MGNSYNNTTINSGSGDQNIAQGDGAIGKQVNLGGPQAPVEDLLKIIAALKTELPGLPNEVRAELEHEVAGAELQARKPEPDREKIAATLDLLQNCLFFSGGEVFPFFKIFRFRQLSSFSVPQPSYSLCRI
ncbi:MAG: hypothetical protein ACL93V_07280 [Candidatus Electrothrix sp. YB6]